MEYLTQPLSDAEKSARERSNSFLYRVPKLDYEYLTQEMLKEHTIYDPETGLFTLIKPTAPDLKIRFQCLGSYFWRICPRYDMWNTSKVSRYGGNLHDRKSP